MRLYHYFRSSAAFRTRIALNLKGVSHELVGVDLRGSSGDQHKPGYLAVNPQGLVPALEVETSIIPQSLAIIEYLDEVHPDPPFLPGTALERAQIRSLALAIACDIHPLNNLRVLNYLRAPLGHDEDAVNAWYHHWIASGFKALEVQARAKGDGRHMYGSAVTMADICMVPQMYNARRLKCDVTAYPTLRAVCAHLETLPAFARAAPEAQADAT